MIVFDPAAWIADHAEMDVESRVAAFWLLPSDQRRAVSTHIGTLIVANARQGKGDVPTATFIEVC